jgi:SAM-dependent methyltransferase
MKKYTRNFYQGQQQRSLSSARAVLPLVMELIRPASVVDVGCGTGAWLSVFREQGVDKVRGVDGPWVDQDMLLIPSEHFVCSELDKPLPLSGHFDLVMSLEVAEHLPEQNAAAFVASLTGLGDVVLFSAAIPGQGGTHHVNEQWPEYWAALFEEQGFLAIDCIRNRVWRDEQVEWWYAQNMLLFVRRSGLNHYPQLLGEWDGHARLPLSLVHPKQYLAAREPTALLLGQLLPALPAITGNSFTGMVRTLLGRV